MFAASPAAPAAADTAPTGAGEPTTVAADGLGAPQINGVVWSQVVVNNTVYVTGEFANARPAGSAAGVNTVARNNFLTFDITTGALSSVNTYLNAPGQVIAVSPDKTRVYIGGDFTSAGGSSHNNLVAINTATGAVVTSFVPQLNARVKAIAATNSTVYVGGSFTSANGVERKGLAAFNASDGSLQAWNPSADNGIVTAMVMAPANDKLIVGGKFTTIGGQGAYGLAAVDVTSGALLPWAAGSSSRNDGVNTIQNAGVNATITSLVTDGEMIYGSGYVFGDGGNLEGVFEARADTGAIVWVDDCHGDTYSVYPMGDTIYSVGHPHFCGDIGGFPQTNPWTFYRSIAMTKTATGVSTPDPYGYHNWAGTPSPTLLNWFPSLNAGTYTGQGQAAWSVTGNSNYVVEGGEFTTVNGVAQQGLVRFAVKTIAPNKIGPTSVSNPSVVSLSSGTARVALPATSDRDNQALTYKIVRDGKTATPVYTTTVNSTFWQKPNIGFVDTGLVPGSTHSYRVYVTDPFNNGTSSGSTTVTVSSATSGGAYSNQVIADGASQYYRLGESSGATVYDYAGFSDAVANSGVTRGAAGALNNDADTASTFDGNTGLVATQASVPGPNTFTIEAWFKTTTTSGGKILGFGDTNTGNSSNYDRHIYMDPSGHVNFGVYNNNSYILTSPKAYNDGQWHQSVATLSSAGMVLYVDGKRIARGTGTTIGQPYNGYWRIGGDSSWNGNNYFAGDIDEVSIYPTALNTQQVNSQWSASGRTSAIATVPADAYGAAVYNDDPDLFWRLNDASGTTAVDSSSSSEDGVYNNGVALQQAGALTGTSDKAAGFNGSGAFVASTDSYSNPTTYSEELWFKTTTNVGGKLIGFGNSNTGQSSSYDRHVYMNNNGQLEFGAYTGQLNIAQTSGAYNDGNWHYMVATQGSDGMKLYVDGALAATNPQTGAQAYSGYWKVGGDTTWNSSSAYINATIDEVAVYSKVLTPADITDHYNLGAGIVPNQAPTASFTFTSTGLSTSFDGSTSSDPDGTIASYAWDFGDGTTSTSSTPTHVYAGTGSYTVSLTVTDNSGATSVATQVVSVIKPNQPPVASFTTSASGATLSVDGTGSTDSDGSIASYAWDFGDGGSATTATASHSYATSGSYTVKLTVTDNQGAVVSTTQSVAITVPNQSPVAAFTAAPTDLSVAFNGSGSSDPDGTVASYSWNFGDLSATGTGATPNHTYAAAGMYAVTLTVTDNGGATNALTQTVTVVASNQPPVAAFTSLVTAQTATFDGSTSSDSDGTIASYSWNYGDGSAVGTGPAPSHTYNSGGTFTVTLTVKDNSGASTSISHDVTIVAANVAPTARFTSSASDLTAAFNGSTSSDSDGTVASYSWDFGDSSAAGTGSTPSHTYAAAGTYTVVLKVTDNQGATDTVSHTVTVTAPVTNAAFITDLFGRTATAGLGTADLGGAWTTVGTAGNLSVSGGTANLLTPTAGSGARAYLGGTSAQSTSSDITVQVSADKVGTGGGTYSYVVGRRLSTTSEYRTRIRFAGGNKVGVALSALEGSATETSLASESVLPGTFAPGTKLNVRLQVFGTSPTTIRVKVWADGTTEPSTWLLSATDSYAALQAKGAISFATYLSGSSTNAPTTISFDNLNVTPVSTGTTPPPANVAPTARFTSSASDLTAAFNGSTSSDSDGTVASYSWDFGDSSAAGTGSTPSHTYAAAGTYTVVLKVTDNQGATDTVSHTVTVTAPVTNAAFITDLFGRTATAGLGTADLGGAWTTVGTAGNLSVSGGTANLLTPTAGSGARAYLGGTSAQSTSSDITVQVSADKVGTGGGTYSYVVGRRLSTTSEYRTRIRFAGGNKVGVALSALEGSATETSLASESVLPGTFAPGTKLNVRLQVFGTSPTTIRVKVWADGTTEPSTWLLSATDSYAALQAKGAISFATYLSGSSTNAPTTISFDNLNVTPVQ